MFKFQQSRTRATARAELVKASSRAEDSRKFKTWKAGFVLLTDDKRGFANDCNEPVHIAGPDLPRGAAFATDEEHVLHCLGAALAMQWTALPTVLQREILDTAAESVERLGETAELRGQIARFLHKHSEARRRKLPLTKDTPGDARWGAAALSRWDNEGGAVRDELPM
jgi:hypothetical protein